MLINLLIQGVEVLDGIEKSNSNLNRYKSFLIMNAKFVSTFIMIKMVKQRDLTSTIIYGYQHSVPVSFT